MNNKTIRISLASVLLFVLFQRIYDLLLTLLLWSNIQFQIQNKFVFISINSSIGIVSLIALIYIANRILSNEEISNKIIYSLIGATIFLAIGYGLLNRYYGEFLANSELGNFNYSYAFQYAWSKEIRMILPIIGLIYFLWKLNKNNVANNSYKT